MSDDATDRGRSGQENPADVPAPAERGEAALVTAAVAQGVLLGVWLAVFPDAALRAGSFPPAGAFFVRWAGMLHAVLAVGYALDWLRFRRTTLLVLVKTATALFLAVTWAIDRLPPLMVVAIVVEAGTAMLAAILHGPAERSRRARARLRLVTPFPTRIRSAGRQ